MGQHLGRAEDASAPSSRMGAGLVQSRPRSRSLQSSHTHTSGSSAATSASTRENAGGSERRISSKTRVDGGFVVRQGLYKDKTDYADMQVRQWIVERRLSPFFAGADDEEELEGAQVRSECPICFLFYPMHLNQTRCCTQPICTECFVQIQRVDPSTRVPPSSQPAACPFCVEPNFGVVYARDAPSVDAQAAIEHAAKAIGTGGNTTDTKRASFPADHEAVVLVDHVHPHWHDKLDRAVRNAARQANRRVILREEGGSLVPVGVSSSRTGDALATFVAQHRHIGRPGPGGSIILHSHVMHTELQRYAHSSLARRDPNRPQVGDQMARTLAALSPEELEELMLRETLRISQLEHQGTAPPEPSQEEPRPERASRRRSLLPTKLAQASPFRFKRRNSASSSSQPRASFERAPGDPAATAAAAPSTPRGSPERPMRSSPLRLSHTCRASLDTPRSSPWAERAIQQGVSRASMSSVPNSRRHSLQLSPALRDLEGLALVPDGPAAPRSSTNPFRTVPPSLRR